MFAPNEAGETLRGLGWDISSAYSRTLGSFFPIGSVGHTGFTGTSIWMDPPTRTYVIILTNRVHPAGKGSVVDLRRRVSAIVGARLFGSDREPATGEAAAEAVAPANADTASGVKVQTGLDVLESDDWSPLRGKVVGLVTNQTGVDAEGRRNVALLAKAQGVRLQSIFAPEHGLDEGVGDVPCPPGRLANERGRTRIPTVVEPPVEIEAERLAARGERPVRHVVELVPPGHALACAALMPERVISASTLGGVAPYPADGLDWMAGMATENVVEFGAAVAGPPELQTFLEGEAPRVASVTPDEVAASLRGLVSDVDRAAITGEYADWLADVFRASVRHGIWGWFDDDLAFTKPWGFEPSSIRCPVAIWQGGEDRMVPLAHGEWLAAHIPGARAHLYPEHGHLSLVASIGAVLDDLIGP